MSRKITMDIWKKNEFGEPTTWKYLVDQNQKYGWKIKSENDYFVTMEKEVE